MSGEAALVGLGFRRPSAGDSLGGVRSAAFEGRRRSREPGLWAGKVASGWDFDAWGIRAPSSSTLQSRKDASEHSRSSTWTACEGAGAHTFRVDHASCSAKEKCPGGRPVERLRARESELVWPRTKGPALASRSAESCTVPLAQVLDAETRANTWRAGEAPCTKTERVT